MRRRLNVALTLLLIAITSIANAQQSRLIVRDQLGLSHLSSICLMHQCKVERGLGDPRQQVFLVSAQGTTIALLSQFLLTQIGIMGAELDQIVTLQSPPLSSIPESLFDSGVVAYFGTPAWNGYVAQPANVIVGTTDSQQQFHVSGAGIVAVIDTGVDTQHPALASTLMPGYDFTRSAAGGDETGDLNHSTAAVLDSGGGCGPIYVTPQVAAAICPAAAIALQDPQYSSFGHGTMTVGIVHMIAPTARILPLKAFSSNGTGNLSDVVRAVYYAVSQNSRVISMSFSFSSYSSELANSISFANSRGVICVASAGNDGQKISVYPASLPGVVGVASTSDYDTRSSFSNYGSQVVWLAAPGENIVSTYPYGTYSSSSGTSFSAPIVAGAAALLLDANPGIGPSVALDALAHARYLSSDLNNGRLDIHSALSAAIGQN